MATIPPVISGSVTYGGIGIVQFDDGSGTVSMRCRDCSVNVSQNMEFYDHSIGLVDTLETTLDTKGEQVAPYTLNYQKLIWRPGISVVSGSINFPAIQSTFSKIFEMAKRGTWFKLYVYYDCNILRTYNECRINTANFTCSAGDMLNCTIDIMGSHAEESVYTSVGALDIDVEKMITWDTVVINPQTITGVTATTFNPLNGMQSFELSINNNCIPIYTQKSMSNSVNGKSYMPSRIRIGMQEVTGSITFYTKGSDIIKLSGATGEGIINFSVADFFSQDISVVYKPIQRNNIPGMLVYQLPFQGVGKPLGT